MDQTGTRKWRQDTWLVIFEEFVRYHTHTHVYIYIYIYKREWLNTNPYVVRITILFAPGDHKLPEARLSDLIVYYEQELCGI